MKVFVVGATGRVGQKLVKNLLDDGHQVTATTRRPMDVGTDGNLTHVRLDIHSDVESMKTDIAGMDAIYFVAGSRGKDLLQTDLFGAIKLMDAANELGIKRFVMLSSLFADDPTRWSEGYLVDLTDYNIAKYMADEWLKTHVDLDYTIIQAGGLIEENGTGNISMNVTRLGNNPIEDVAKVLSSVLEAKNTYKKVIRIHEGNTPIQQAIESI